MLKRPAPSLVDWRCSLVVVLVIVIVAPCTAAPVLSVTNPWMMPVGVCACAKTPRKARTIRLLNQCCSRILPPECRWMTDAIAGAMKGVPWNLRSDIAIIRDAHDSVIIDEQKK